MLTQSVGVIGQRLVVAFCTILYVTFAARGGKLAYATAVLDELRKTPWNAAMEQRLAEHPYVLSAEDGTLTLAQRRAFVLEQFSIQRQDAASFASLAGHASFAPATLLGAKVPPCAACATNASQRLFQYLAEGEVYASSLLIDQAVALGLDDAGLAAHIPTPQAQAYPRQWARLARSSSHAAGAAAAAINFPAWGHMCARVRTALASGAYGAVSERELGFLGYFAEPIPDLEARVAAVLIEEAGASDAEAIAAAVRRQQQAELAFWDAIYAPREEGREGYYNEYYEG